MACRWFSYSSRGALLLAIVASGVIMIPRHASAQDTPAPTVQQSAPSMARDVAAADARAPGADAKKGIAGRTVDRVKELAKDASDVFARVPCAKPKAMKFEGSLPRIAHKLAANEPIVIVAFGSSSTAGYGATSPAFSYPNRLADQLRRTYPKADITVMNQGVGGEDTPEMMARLQTSVLANNPDLVIWQLGTNTVVRGGDIDGTLALVEEGLKRIKTLGADVVLVDPQYSPATIAKEADANKMVGVISRAAQLAKVGVFPRFSVMKEWHKDQGMPFDNFGIADGLHMNDWGYACFAQLLGDTIIKTVGEVKAGVEVPSNVLTYRPM